LVFCVAEEDNGFFVDEFLQEFWFLELCAFEPCEFFESVVVYDAVFGDAESGPRLAKAYGCDEPVYEGCNEFGYVVGEDGVVGVDYGDFESEGCADGCDVAVGPKDFWGSDYFEEFDEF